MTTSILTPRDEADWLDLRTRNINSTESSALFGLSPYATHFELWHQKKSGTVVTIDENERMRWGKRLEGAIASGIAADRGWDCRPLKCYMQDEADRIGSSFDYEVVDDKGRKGILEIKNVDRLAYKQGWLEHEDGTFEAPAHIETQLQHQLEVAYPHGYEFGIIGALVGGNTPAILIREREADVGAAIRRKVREFWASVDANATPSPVYPEDAEFVVSLNQHAEPGSFVDRRGDAALAAIAAEYRAAADAEKEASDRKTTAKAQLLEAVGDAERALIDGFTLSAGLVGPTHVEYDRKGYRNFRLTQKKEK